MQDFAARQQAARAFTTRQQSLAGLAPDSCRFKMQLQKDAKEQQHQGLGSFEPFVTISRNNKQD